MLEHRFVAYERELARLDKFLAAALAGEGQVCFVVGEAGAGKTALVTEFARRAQAKQADLVVVIGNCNSLTGVSDPFLPFREMLGLLTGDVEAKLAQGAITQENAHRLKDFLRLSGNALVEVGPDLIGIFVPLAGLVARATTFLAGERGWLARLEKIAEHEPPGTGDLEQGHIFDQYTQVLGALARQRPLVLVVDDLQWADRASIGLLFHLARRIGGSRILIVGAYRPDDVALGRGGERHPLDPLVNDLKRYFGDISVDLDAARDAGGRRFVNDFLDSEPNRLGEDFRRALFQRTGGHPLFTIELLRDMQERGDLVQDRAGCWAEGPALDWGTLATRVEGVIEERIGRLEEELRETLTVASVEGSDFIAQVVARVQEVQERRLLRDLSRELERRHRLVKARGEEQVGERVLSRYQFAHTLFQQYLYNDLSAGERRLLHGQTAVVLEHLYEGQTEGITVQLARHYAEAGDKDKAVEYLLEAGDMARALYAHQEAIDLYQRALQFLKEQGKYERAARTLMKLGLTYHTAFDFTAARQAYEEGFSLWQHAGAPGLDVPLPVAPHALRVDATEPPTLDPTMAGDSASIIVNQQLFSGLVELTPQLDVVPDGARSWEISEGGRKYVFHLRNDVRWTDGVPVTARDFEVALLRALDPATGSPIASLLYDVLGARAFHQGQGSKEDVGVQALDGHTLVLTLEAPTSYFLQLLAGSCAYPLPRHVLDRHGAAWIEVGNIVTNGPFTLEAWHRGHSLVLSRNPDYHRRFRGNVQRVELRVRDDASAQLARYEAGELDAMETWPLPLLEGQRAVHRHAGEYVSVPQLSTFYMGFDVSRPPFDDHRVRRAFALATDRETMADVFLRGEYFPATGGFVPPGMPGHSAGIGLPYDPQEARNLLAEAGYPAGQGFPDVDALAMPGVEQLLEYLRVKWRENLGLEIAWNIIDWVALLSTLGREPPHLFMFGWAADYPDPDNFLRVWDTCRQTGWRSEAYERRVEEARRLTDHKERMSLYGQADKILIDEAAIVPLVYHRHNLLLKPWLAAFPISVLGWWFFKDVIIEAH